MKSNQQLPDPVVLRDRGEALVEEELQAVVVRMHGEATSPQVRAPVSNGVDETDELSLVRGEGAMPWGHRSTEVSDGVLVLDQHSPEAVGGRVALDDEQPCEVW